MFQKTPQTRVLFGRCQKMVGLLVFGVFLFTAIFTSLHPKTASATTTSTLNFQARLMTATGGIVPDGYYNIEFKLYNASSSSGSSQGSCTGDAACLWTETYYDSNGVIAGNDNRVRVLNGYLTVNLGSLTSFPAISWDQQLWLTMRVGGSTQTATPTYDPEMSPRLQLTAVPYAFKAGDSATLGGTAKSGFIQNTTSAQSSNLYVQAASSGSVAGTFRANAAGAGGILSLLDGTGASLAGFDVTGQLYLGRAGGSGATGSLKLYNSTNSNTVTIQSGTTGTSYTLTLPTALGSSGDCLKDTTGAGVLGFASCGGGSGVTSVGAISGTSNANGATITGSVLNLTAADGTNGGVLTNTTQTIAGDKTFSGAVSAGTSLSLAAGNFLQSGSGTFGTGTGAVSLNGDTTVAAGKNLSLAAGVGTLTQNFNLTSAGTAQTLTLSNASGTNTNGIFVNHTGAGTTTNGINITEAAGTLSTGLNIAQTGGTLTTGINFGGTIGTLISSGSFVVSGVGAISGATGLSMSGAFLQSGTGTFTQTYTNTSGTAATINANPTSGTVTNALLISAGGAGAVTNGLNFTGTFTSLINATNFSVTNSGIITTATLGAATTPVALCRNSSNQISSCGINTAGVTLQNAYDASTDPELVADNTRGGLTIRDNATPITVNSGNLLEIQNSAGSTTYMAVTTAGTSTTALTATGAIVGVGVNSGSGLLQGTGGLTLTSATSINFNTNSTTSINTGTSTGQVTIGGGSGTFALQTTNINISTAGAITGATGVALSSGNIAQSGSGTVSTGTGTVSLNGDTTIASGKNLTLTDGTYTHTLSATSGSLAIFNATNASLTQTNGLLFNRNASSGTTTNGINVTNTAGTLTNGLSFTGTIGTDINRGSGTLTVQGAGGVTITSSAGNIQIGSASTDGTTTALILDSSNVTTEPAGTNGMMYYNSDMRTMRCFSDSVWEDCDTGSMRSQWLIKEDFAGQNNGASGSTQVGDYGWRVTQTGTGTATVNSVGAINATQDNTIFTAARLDTAATAGNGDSLQLTNGLTGFPTNMTVEFSFGAFNAAAAAGLQQIVRIGLHNSITSAAPTNGIYFEYSTTTVAGNWSRCTANNGGTTCTSTGVAYDTVNNNYHRFTFRTNSAGTGVEFFIDGNSVGTNSTNLPNTANSYSPTIQAITVDATIRMWKIDYFYLNRRLTTLR